MPTHARQVGDWDLDFSIEGIQIAKVVNASGTALGILCTLGVDKCVAYLALSDMTCSPGKSFPMMMNIATGATNLSARCEKLEVQRVVHMLVLDEFSAFTSAVESGGEIGFAVPLDDGKFQVMRFSSRGAVAAVRAARSRPTGSETQPTRQSGSSRRL